MNTTGSGFTPDDERRHQARIWYIQRRSDSKKLPHALEKRWRQWAHDPANVTAYRNFGRLHSMLLSVPPPSLPSAAELHADSSDLRLDTHADSAPVPGREMTPPRWSRPLVQVWVACAVVAIIVLAWVAPRISGLSDITLAQTWTYVTPPGVPREITLPDRSIVTLSGSARLTALFSKHRRRLVLTEGEAFFKVRHDPAAPFQVEAGSARIVDEGTIFDVHLYSDRVVVSVAEGAVTVIPDTRANAADTPVKGGEQVTYDAKGEVSRPHVAALEAITSWLFGRRIYHGEPLSKVIEDVQLYVPLQIDLDRALKSVRFSGSIDKLDSQQAESWVRGLRNIYPVEVDENSHLMFIRCSSPGCPGIHP
jgi:transmembrane sensor